MLRLITLLILLSPSALAKERPSPIGSLIRFADLIVIGTSSAVDKDGVAEIRVERTLKGLPPEHLFFYARPTWICDTTVAKEGERSLFLFMPQRFAKLPSGISSDVRQVQLSGGGKIDLLKDGARIAAPVLLPPDLPVVVDPGSDPFTVLASSEAVIALVEGCIADSNTCPEGGITLWDLPAAEALFKKIRLERERADPKETVPSCEARRGP